MSEESEKRIVSETDKKKAQIFFERGRSVAQNGQYEYAIDMFCQGFAIDPEAVTAHQELRDIALKRKVTGGKDLGMFEKMKLRYGKDDLANMILAEKLLAYDPGNSGRMLEFMQYAMKSECHDTILWIANILMRANAETPKPEVGKFLACKDAYVKIRNWQQATEAAQRALQLRPTDMDLQTLVKNLGAQQTMYEGGYTSDRGFSGSVKNMDAQQSLMREDTDDRSLGVLKQQMVAARAEYEKEPHESGKITKLVDILEKTEDSEYENDAITILEKAYDRTKQYRYRLRVGEIKMKQLKRMERSMREQVNSNPKDEQLIKDYKAFVREKVEVELKEFEQAAAAYPTDIRYRYETAIRMVQLKRYTDAIPLLQQAVQDPKLRVDATVMLGRAFLDAEFVDEAIDTLKGLTETYQLQGDTKYKEIFYWYGRALEVRGDGPDAIKALSKVAMADFNYRDVQARIKALRAK